ncbi:hypothetical protein F4Y59_09140 [Candidatus Poribacteria bacterium]|nr:hypothetical protein [Candidatus Poribacteria bacterium]
MNGNTFEEMVITTLNELRQDMSFLRREISDVKAEISDVKAEISDVKIDLHKEITDVKTDLHKEITDVKTDVAWVKGKLEGRSDTRHVVLTGISIFVAICAVVVAFLK